jgi:hypothetical protein
LCQKTSDDRYKDCAPLQSDYFECLHHVKKVNFCSCVLVCLKMLTGGLYLLIQRERILAIRREEQRQKDGGGSHEAGHGHH